MNTNQSWGQEEGFNGREATFLRLFLVLRRGAQNHSTRMRRGAAAHCWWRWWPSRHTPRCAPPAVTMVLTPISDTGLRRRPLRL